MERKYAFHPQEFAIGETRQFYTKMAGKGWLLVKRGAFLSSFRRSEPETIRYGIVPAVPAQSGEPPFTEEQIADMNIDVLPATLGEACDAFEEDKYIQEVLGEHISKKYLEAKRKEWHEYCRQVSDWETEAYLYKY